MLRSKSLKIFNEETNTNFYAWQIIIQGFLYSRRYREFMDETIAAQTADMADDHGISAIELQDWNHLGYKLLEKLKNQEINLDKILQYHYHHGEKIFKLYKIIRAKNLDTISNRQFLIWFNTLWINFLELNGIGLIPVLSDYEHGYLSTELTNILKRKRVGNSNINNYLSVLMAPDQPLAAWQERLELLQIAEQQKTIIKAVLSKNFKNHMEKFEWLNYGYQGPAITERDFLIEAKKILIAKKSVKQQLAEHKHSFQNFRRDIKLLEQKLHLTKQEKYLFRAARVFTFAKGYRIDVRYAFHFICDRMFETLSRRFFLPLNWFHYAERPEIERLLQGKKFDTSKILKRSKGMLWVGERRRQYFVPPEKQKVFRRKFIIKDVVSDTAVLTGQPAYVGKVRGKIKIVRSVQDVGKVDHGDILTAINTTPDMLPAMRRAAAFITDFGGITSHAAIVSRELKKPCIIGTKIATKIFKDEDLVEVDANKGIIKKL